MSTMDMQDDTFAAMYYRIANRLASWKDCRVEFACRGLQMGREMAAALRINIAPKGVSIFSHVGHRVVPIKFILAELC